MGDVFKPWRRKNGIVTLVMALVFMGGWVRSFRINDESYYHYGEQSCVFIGSGDGLIIFGRSLANTPNYFLPRGFGWWSNSLNHQLYFESHRNDYSWVWQVVGFQIGFLKELPDELDENAIVTLPYGLIAIPLTLLSAYLLLKKNTSCETEIHR